MPPKYPKFLKVWHLYKVLTGGGLFIGQTRMYWTIGSYNNGFVHSFRKPQFALRTFKLVLLYTWVYTKFYQTRLHRVAMYAFRRI